MEHDFGRRFFLARRRDGSWWACGHCESTSQGAPPAWSPPILAAPRRLPLRFEPWALAPGFGNALLLARDGTLWSLSFRPDTSRSAIGLLWLKTTLNQAARYLPGHPQPFDLKEFHVEPITRKLWELPAEARLQSATPS